MENSFIYFMRLGHLSDRRPLYLLGRGDPKERLNYMRAYFPMVRLMAVAPGDDDQLANMEKMFCCERDGVLYHSPDEVSEITDYMDSLYEIEI